MKHLWILLISICCSLTVFGQHQKTDSTSPEKNTRTQVDAVDTQRAERSMPSQKQVSAGRQKKDTGKAAKTTAKKRIDTANAHSPKQNIQNRADSSKRGAAAGAASGNGNSPDNVSPGKDTLSPAQLQAQYEAKEQRRQEARKDSIYNTHRRQLLASLRAAALNRDDRRPEYSIYFPDYFYDNNRSGNGALVHLHAYQDRDLLFYAFMAITLLLALIKIIFPRYFNQVFWFFLHPNDRRSNAPEQISGQNILPSLLLNLFFVLTGGLFLAQVLRPDLPQATFWVIWALSSLLLTGVYLIKFLVILVSGWVFGAPTAATIYNQVVFSINKIIGLLLLPATLLISYGTERTQEHVFSTVIVIIVILLIYRYIASFLLIKGKLKVSAFHFILYLCAVEIIPLLLVYKVLLTNMGRLM